MPPTLKTIRHFKSEWGTGAELRPEIVSWIVTDDAPVSYRPVCSLFPVTPRGLCESQKRPRPLPPNFPTDPSFFSGLSLDYLVELRFPLQ